MSTSSYNLENDLQPVKDVCAEVWLTQALFLIVRCKPDILWLGGRQVRPSDSACGFASERSMDAASQVCFVMVSDVQRARNYSSMPLSLPSAALADRMSGTSCWACRLNILMLTGAKVHREGSGSRAAEFAFGRVSSPQSCCITTSMNNSSSLDVSPGSRPSKQGVQAPWHARWSAERASSLASVTARGVPSETTVEYGYKPVYTPNFVADVRHNFVSYERYLLLVSSREISISLQTRGNVTLQRESDQEGFLGFAVKLENTVTSEKEVRKSRPAFVGHNDR